MNAATYAKLIKPPQFQPDEEVTFRMEFSQDLICCWATLKIYGYSLSIDGNTYTGTSVTEYINVSWLGTGWVEFKIPANTLAVLPTDDKYGFSGKMKACVEIGVQQDENGNAIPQFTSNEVLVNMIVPLPNDFIITDSPLTANGSTHQMTIRYVPRTTLGEFGCNDINSYQVLLYDTNYNLVSNSGVLYDWENSSDTYKEYLLSGLSDNTDYYVKVKATLVGGYTLSTDYTALSVRYEDFPTSDSHLKLYNDTMNGCVVISLDTDIEYDKIVLNRSIIYEDNYLELRTIQTNSLNSINDYYALPNKTYVYKVVLYKNDSIVATYYNTITHKFDGICIADAYAGYGALAWDSIYPINRNERGSIIEPMDSELPYYIINGNLNYDSGTVSNALFTPMNNCEVSTEDNAMYSKTIRVWLNNGRTKLLKYYNGECWLVAVSTPSDDKTDMIRTSFNWTEVGDANKNEDYIRLGLIIDE